MSSDSISLSAELREATRKSVAELREKGLIPGVVYGHEVENQMVQVPLKALQDAYSAAGESTLVNLTIGDQAAVPVLIHDVEYEPLTHVLQHVDFYVVNMKEEVTAEVPLNFVGVSMAVKSMGGVLVKTKDHLTIKCLPQDLLSEIEVDISSLATFDDVIHVSDISVSDKVEVQDTPEDLVATVSAPRTAEELAELDSEVNEDVSSVEGAEEKKADADDAGDKKAEDAK